MKTPRIFITGATGFAGRHLIAFLNARAASAQSEIFGSCFPERPESCSELCAAVPNLRLLYLDLRDAEACADALKSVRPDLVFHLAAMSQVRQSWEKRRDVFDTNLLGTYNIFEAARLHIPLARILFVSSSDVYGFLSPRRRPLRESDEGSVVSPYAFTKKSGELLSEFYAVQEKLPVVTARPFPHTGPGQSPDFVCSDWARQIALIEKYKSPEDSGTLRPNEPVIHVGTIALRRDYSDVRDVVRAYWMLLRKGRPGQVYNVCSGRATSLETILATLVGFSRRRIAVAVDPGRIRKVDIPSLSGDRRKIEAETGWRPRIPLERTLSDLLEDWRARV